MAKTANNKNNSYDSAGTAFVGCIILGTGVGFIIDHVVAGALIGVGVGFLVMAFMRGSGR